VRVSSVSRTDYNGQKTPLLFIKASELQRRDKPNNKKCRGKQQLDMIYILSNDEEKHIKLLK